MKLRVNGRKDIPFLSVLKGSIEINVEGREEN
jgi:hypothetical protein